MALKPSAGKGKLELINLLLADTRVNTAPYDHLDDAFTHAAEKGRTKVIKRLLKEPFLNPHGWDDLTLNKALLGKHFKVSEIIRNN